jgi:hypothetical protein
VGFIMIALVVVIVVVRILRRRRLLEGGIEVALWGLLLG